MTDTIDLLDGIEGDSVLECRVDYPDLHIIRGDRLAIAEREPTKGETTVVLIDGKATLGVHPVKDASKTLGVVTGVVRRLS